MGETLSPTGPQSPEQPNNFEQLGLLFGQDTVPPEWANATDGLPAVEALPLFVDPLSAGGAEVYPVIRHDGLTPEERRAQLDERLTERYEARALRHPGRYGR